MRLATIRVSEISRDLRFDAKYFSDEGYQAAKTLAAMNCEKRLAADLIGEDNFWMPNRFNRVFASSAKFGKPFLAPYDTLRYLPPRQAPILSRSENSTFTSCELKKGWLLVVRSGRNLGPPTMVDEFLSEYALSDDMIRVSGNLDDEHLYLFGFLHTNLGKVLLRRDKSGSVIDHLGPNHVAELLVPILPDGFNIVVPEFRKAFEIREHARLSLYRTIRSFEKHIGTFQVTSESGERRQFEILRSAICDRFDAEPFAPSYERIRDRVRTGPNPTSLSSLAHIAKPPGRYRTVYVEDEKYGRRLLSGRQMEQIRPVGLKLMSDLAFNDPKAYELAEGMTLLTADGRAEENLADTVYIASDRNGWLASGHIHRLTPKQKTHPGLLYLACASNATQKQLKALATGSVVDALSEIDVGSVLVSYPEDKRALELAAAAISAWEDFAVASSKEDTATAAFNEALDNIDIH